MLKENSPLLESACLEDYRLAGGSPHSPTNQRILGDLVHREVVCCVSMLVSHFASNPDTLNGSDYNYDEVLSLCENRPDSSDWGLEKCKNFLENKGEPLPEPNPWDMDREELIETGFASGVEICPPDYYNHLTEDNLRKNVIDAIDHEEMGGIEDWREAVQDCDPDEVYEHWVVSDWLARRLREKGETIGELFNLTIWGRQNSGQAILLDNVIAEIAAEMQILEGQQNDWSEHDKDE